jgi:hypothetical protein
MAPLAEALSLYLFVKKRDVQMSGGVMSTLPIFILAGNNILLLWGETASTHCGSSHCRLGET